MLLVPAADVVGQVLANLVNKIRASPRDTRLLRPRQTGAPGGHEHTFVRMRELPARREPPSLPCEFCASVTTRPCEGACAWCCVPDGSREVAWRLKLGRT